MSIGLTDVWPRMNLDVWSCSYRHSKNIYSCNFLPDFLQGKWWHFENQRPIFSPKLLRTFFIKSESRSVVSDSLRPHGLLPTRILSPWNLQTKILEWVTVPFRRGSSQPRDQTQVSHIVGGSFAIWATREALLYYSMSKYGFNNKERN